MKQQEFAQQRLVNWVRTWALLGGMATLMAVIGFWVWGPVGLVIVTGIGVGLGVIGGRASKFWALRVHRAVPVSWSEAPALTETLNELARRAKLPAAPELYYVPTGVMNAFAVGTQRDSAIAVTEGLLRNLDQREVTGVLAHEVGHLRNGDLTVMTLANAFTRLTHHFSFFGQILVLINLPLVIMGGASMPWIPILLLVLAPSLNTMLQLAVARTREHDADIEAARLTGDPGGLASALAKMEALQRGWVERLFGRRDVPAYLRTHPAIDERIEKLRQLADDPRRQRPIRRKAARVVASPGPYVPYVFGCTA